jgi:hypothetical protein
MLRHGLLVHCYRRFFQTSVTMYFILLQRLFENLSYHADVRGRVEAWRFVAGHWRVINEQFHASVVFCLVSIGL